MHVSAAQTRENRSSQPGQQPRLPELRMVRILAVDDDPQAFALIEMALSEAHFESALEVMPTAAQGLRRIAADEHDVYLVDQQLPDGTGVDLIRAAKESGASKPFILITGHGSGDIDEAALREGAADYVEKHLLETQLQRSIRYALRGWQATRALHDRDEQLRHAQKMEAIGRLAGGVAHDFNNLLTAIIGYTDLVAERLGAEDPIGQDVLEIRKAADSATALTRQLMAFSRKQFLAPEVLDLNEIVSGMLPMLPRVIGEHIETSTNLGRDLGHVRVDPSQMEQVLVNLVLNARDAMPGGGRLNIETFTADLDDDRIAEERLPLAPGRYSVLEVRDNGMGMDADTLTRAFEPFFTTKPKGRGAGLGLSTVYGIVDQSGGAITLESALNRGTAVRIYLPVADRDTAALANVRQAVGEAEARTGTETLLLVEDNDAVRDLAVQALRSRGYTVHEARNAEEAIEWSLTSQVKPSLLVTDVIMPGLSGPNLAARLLRDSPDLRVLYMSGYTDHETAVHGAFWGGVPLLEKPFTPAQLAERVRLALDSTVDRS
jgi:two-component system, cell cycle sensor histidine kinase and response regulator CckA